MRNALDLSKRETVTQLQGDFVLVKRNGFPDRLFQFRTLVQDTHSSLRLVFRHDGKGGKRVDWPVTQDFLNALKARTPDAAVPNDAKWTLVVA